MKQYPWLILSLLIAGMLSNSTWADPLGNTYVAGTTWYDLQHNGSCGRMVGVDDSGFAHVAWMASPTADTDHSRYIRYNRWIPTLQAFEYSGGLPIDSHIYSGFVTLAVRREGCPLFGYHQWRADLVSMLSGVNICADQYVFPPPRYEAGAAMDIIWPQIARSVNGVIHLLSEGDNAMGMYENRVYYSRGVIHTDSVGMMSVVWQDYEGTGFSLVGWTCNIAHTIACSRHSSRVARVWLQSLRSVHDTTDSMYDNDVMVQTSYDDGLTWNPPVNITGFIPGDATCYNQTGDWQVCSRDTFRAFQEISLLFDESDVLHVAFTTIGYYTWDAQGQNSITNGASLIWHWSEGTGQFSLVAHGWFDGVAPGAYQKYAQKPSLAIDPVSGVLYCAYILYNPDAVSEGGFPDADVWITASTNNGVSWSRGSNVTRSTPSVIPTPAGQCSSERDPTLAETVEDGILHLTYELDRDAGSVLYDEGAATLNDFVYQRVPVDSIALTPLLPRYPLHCDSSGFASVRPARVAFPKSISLDPVFPNPFNSRATITFELPAQTDITLSIFDILGRDVQTLVDGKIQAGSHAVEWNASGFASGLYFVRLHSINGSAVQKVMLLK